MRWLTVLGLAIATVGMILLTGLPVHGSYVSDLLIGLVPMSIGMGLAFVSITLMATSGVDDADSGLASGLFNTAQQVGGSLGLAVLSTLSTDHTTSAVRDGVAPALATVEGFQIAFVGAAVGAICETVAPLHDLAPDVWRRYVDLVFDGLRAAAAHPLSQPAPTPGQLERAIDAHLRAARQGRRR